MNIHQQKGELMAKTQVAEEKPEVLTVRTSAGLRDTLFDELDRVINGKSTPAQANAVARLADQIAATVHLEIEVKKMALRTTGSVGEQEQPLGVLKLGAGRG